MLFWITSLWINSSFELLDSIYSRLQDCLKTFFYVFYRYKHKHMQCNPLSYASSSTNYCDRYTLFAYNILLSDQSLSQYKLLICQILHSFSNYRSVVSCTASKTFACGEQFASLLANVQGTYYVVSIAIISNLYDL